MKRQRLAKKQKPDDVRIRTKHFSWFEYVITYFILLVLSSGQAMIFATYVGIEGVPMAFIFGMLGYWAIVSAVFTIVTHFQIRKKFDLPMQRMSAAAKAVAEGNFSVRLKPFHASSHYDYMDVMFEDFNRMVEELGSIETLKNDFIANVSHEIKTPLSVIEAYASALRGHDLTPDQRRDYADTIITASKKLTALVTNILRLNKLENQEIAPEPEPYDLCRQLSETALAFERAIEEKKLCFEADIEDRAMIRTDRIMMEIVWHNLMSNAMKFTEPGGTVTLTQTSDDASVTVSVTDTGCGMDEATKKRIFDKFYQGDTSHSAEGNGLGLALARRVVELAGGTIEVQSEPGVGSTFTVQLEALP